MQRWAILLLLVSALAAQQPAKDQWAGWEPFLGVWQGAGGGGLGQGSGEFSFAPELQGAVLVRHNYAEYPAANGKPAFRHDDLMVIYPGNEAKKTRADYWDSEGHVIHYEVEVSAGTLVLLSAETEPGPRYRLTYAKTGEDALQITFEIAPPNDRSDFKPYIQATARRKTPK